MAVSLWFSFKTFRNKNFDENLAKDFCKAIMDPAAREVIDQISRYGLLGLKSGKGSKLCRYWNIAVINATYIHGADTMGQIMGTALSGSGPQPEW